MDIRRMEIEREVAEAVIDALLGVGFEIEAVSDGDVEMPATRNKTAIMAQLFYREDGGHVVCSYDEVTLGVRVPGQDNFVSFVFLVFGNNGWDLVSDYGLTVEDVLKPVMLLCDRLGAENSPRS